MADSFHAFLQDLTVAVTGATHAAAVTGLPRSQVEMTERDREWQDRINKVVRRVARDLIANDDSEISEVVRRVGADGYRMHHQATLRKVVSDRRASLDDETEIKPAIRKVVQGEFTRGVPVPVVYFPENGDTVQDSPRLTQIALDPAEEWRGNGQLIQRIGRWTRERRRSPRLYPAALVWCIRKPGRELRENVELWLAWRRVAQEVSQGVLGAEFDRADRADVQARVRDAEQAAKDEVWAGYRISELAEHFGVHESVASNICNGRTHRRVLPAEDLPPLPVRRTPEEETQRVNEIARRLSSRPR